MSDDSKDVSPDSTERGREVSRRALLRAGTIAAGAGVASVAAATVATPAAADDGDPVILAQNNVAFETTTMQTSNYFAPVLTLDHISGGAPLRLVPGQFPNINNAPGSIFMGNDGTLITIGERNGVKVTGGILPTFSTSVWPVTPQRWLVTLPNFTMPNGKDGRHYVVPGSANFDSAGRVLPKNNPNVPDLTLDFSAWYYENGILGVQGTLLAMNATANGWVSLYDSAEWPGTSTMNFEAGKLRDALTLAGLTSDGKLHVKVSAPVVLVFDIVAFICNNGSWDYREGDAWPPGTGEPHRPRIPE